MVTKLRRARLRRAARRSGAPIIASVLNMAVAGCMVGPDFMSPDPPSVMRYTSPGEATVAGAHGAATVPTQTVALGGRLTAEWWTLFRSPNLDTLVEQAIAGSRTLESAKARLAQAREAIAAASSALYPQVGFNASVTQEKQTAASFGLTPIKLPFHRPSISSRSGQLPATRLTYSVERVDISSRNPHWPITNAMN